MQAARQECTLRFRNTHAGDRERSPVPRVLAVLLVTAAAAASAAAEVPVPPPPPPGPPAWTRPVSSPEVAEDGRVTVRLRAPEAKRVVFAMDGAPPRPMTKGEVGVWSTTTEPLAPDFHP